MSEPTFIIEMGRSDLLLVAQLLHIHIQANPGGSGKRLLDALVEQTNCVFADPQKHQIYDNGLTIPNRAIPVPPAYFVPVTPEEYFDEDEFF